MKKIFTLILVTVLLIVSVSTAYSSSITTDPAYPDYEFSSESGADNTVVLGVFSYNGSEETVTVPTYANDYLIKYIDEKVFYKNQTIEKVYLNENITQIRQWSFRNCPNLRYVYCPESLAVVWKYAFAYSSDIRNMLLNHTQVENFYDGAFMNVTSLKYASLPPTTKSLGYACFSGTSIETLNIPDGVEMIGNSAFANNSCLRKIYIPSSATTLGTDLFSGSENVTVFCQEGSVIHQYCIENNVAFQLISEDEFPTQLPGDVNNSSKVDINDVTAMQKELARIDTEFNAENCDINKNCKFDIRDVTYLQHRLANIDNAY